MENFIKDLGKAWLNGPEGQRRVLLSSMFEKPLVWNMEGYFEHQLKPIFKAFRDNSFKPILQGDPGGIRTRDLRDENPIS